MRTRPKVVLICDMQFGSTGKGLIAGYLAKHTTAPDAVMCAWAPNAGHTFIDHRGRKFMHRMLPNGIVSPALERVFIGPGSVVDIDLLNKEIDECWDILSANEVRVVIHAHAAVVHGDHVVTETGTLNRIGSTQKGTAAANIEKMMRGHNANTIVNEVANRPDHPLWEKVVIADPKFYGHLVDESRIIQLEGAQGFSLGIQSGIYPYVTSRECTPAQMLSDCAIPHSYLHQVVGVLRTFPIRVANRYNEQGEQVGFSGPGYDDQVEMDWSSIGVAPELTTVTKLPRRVFSFSYEQLRQSLRACAPDFIFLNFCNYLTDEAAHKLQDRINVEAGRTIVRWTGHGPTETDVVPHYMGAAAIESRYDRMSVEERNKPHNKPVIW